MSHLVRALVLTSWSAFFGYLWVSDEMVRYLGPRTYWVVPFGCLTLGAAALIHFATLPRDEGGGAISRGDLAGIAALLVPIVAVLAVPGAELGALAVSRKAAGAGATAGLIAPPQRNEGRPPSFIDIHFANESEESAAALGISDGTEVTLVGFVSAHRDTQGELDLTRFYVSCCAADAIPYSVTVATAGGGDYPINSWLKVTGELVYGSTEYRLEPRSIDLIEEPENPYLY